MRIDNLDNYYTTEDFEPTGENRETSLGFTQLVSNSRGVYGVVASKLMLLVTDNWSVAHNYLESLPGPREVKYYDWCCELHRDVVITVRGNSYFCSKCNATPHEMIHLERKEA